MVNNIISCRNNNYFDSVIVWISIERGRNDKFHFKSYQAALAISFPKVKEIKNKRIKGLLEIKSKDQTGF